METWVLWMLIAFGIVGVGGIIGGTIIWYNKRSRNNSDYHPANKEGQLLVKEEPNQESNLAASEKQDEEKISLQGEKKSPDYEESTHTDFKTLNDETTSSRNIFSHNDEIPIYEESQPLIQPELNQEIYPTTPIRQNEERYSPQRGPKNPDHKENKQNEERYPPQGGPKNPDHKENKQIDSEEIIFPIRKFPQDAEIPNYTKSEPLIKEIPSQNSHLIPPIRQNEENSLQDESNNLDEKNKNIEAELNKEIKFPDTEFLHNAGIPNCGNTCYLNSTIQVLVCIPKFVNLLSKSNSDVFKCLSQIFGLVLSNASKENFKPLIRALLNGLKQNYPMFMIMKQNDCKELYNILIDNFFTESECIEKNLFLIKQRKLFVCEKGHEMKKKEIRLFLTIPPNKKLDSEKCIQDIKENESTLEIYCQECGYAINNRILTESLELPEYLVFYITDTTNQGRVPKTYIRADEKEYDLFGVICYYGGGISGHYIAFTLNEDSKWIKYNDAYVDEKDPDYNHAYMLFYKQRITIS